jgi:hypothetical protein
MPGVVALPGVLAATGAAAPTGAGARAGRAAAGCRSAARRGVRAAWVRTAVGAGSENHTTLPFSPSGRAPQLSLIAATIASPRPHVASGPESGASVPAAGTGRRGS